MYKLLLIFKYLRRKLVPLFAAAAVTLCTAMVIVVISIMGGFLQQWRVSAKKLTGEVVIRSSTPDGFAHYDQLIKKLLKHKQIAAASPVVQSFALLKIGNNVHYVMVLGIEPKSLNGVVEYSDALYWTKERIKAEHDRIGGLSTREEQLAPYDLHELGMTLQPPDDWLAPKFDDDKKEETPVNKTPGIVIGIEIDPANQRDENGAFNLWRNRSIQSEVTLTVVPLTQKGGLLEPELRDFIVVNEFKTGLYDRDKEQVFIPFNVLQDMMLMSEAEETDREGNVIGKTPARASQIVVKASDDVDLQTLKTLVDQTVYDFYATDAFASLPRVDTWEEMHAMALGAVQKEKGMLTFLFGIISIVAAVLILVIFYMIVMEKTRDIGTLRALGASQLGIAAIFLGYAKVIGILGAGFGTLTAYFIVTYLNEIHDWLGKGLGVYAFTIGLPAIALFGTAVLAYVCQVIRYQFRVRSFLVVLHMLWISLVVGLLLSGGLIGAKLLFTNQRSFEITPTVISLATIIGIMAIIFSAIAGQYLIAHRLLKKRSHRTRLLSLSMFNALVSLVVIGVCFATVKDLSEILNRTISITIWDRRVYFFDQIPNRIDWVEVAVIVAAAVTASLIGALVPAISAACVDPVESLRYE
jgi:lipoprotein-releasing system permease protein